MTRRWTAALGFCALALTATTAPALADFPYPALGPGQDYSDLRTSGTQAPNDLDGASNRFKYAATPEPGDANAINDAKPTELGGVRGASVVDADGGATAWQHTTGRPDVTIAVLDSGIRWNEGGAMVDVRRKTRIDRGEAPRPLQANGTTCAYDCNGDGVFNIDDYANDDRVLDVMNGDPRRDGPAGVLTPQDALIAFSDPGFAADGKAGGVDDDGNGYVDDMVGWDFLDNDNDPFDDVQYGHGTGEARGSTSEVNNGHEAGSCANCMVIHMRVGDSFIADIDRFAAATVYATDNDVQIVQSALGTLNKSGIAREAVDYAYRHGTTMIVSAADEAAQHNNQPYLPHTILVNSVTEQPTETGGIPPNKSYLAFNGCTNFNAKITIAIPSTSCSSDAVGVGSGMAGLIYSAAFNAEEEGKLDPHPDREAC
jgi:Subtilase family